EFSDADATKYADAAKKIAAANDGTLFLSPPDAFSTTWDGAVNPLGTTFYPDAVTQAFPQAYDVPVSAGRWDAAWSWLNANAPAWWTGKYDASPFVILGW